MTSLRRFSVLLSIVCIAAGAAAQTANWSYSGKTGPITWSKLDPAYAACSAGQDQSPIDIRKARLDTSLAPIEFHYIAGPVVVENNGHTIVVHVDPVSYIVVGGVRYNLVEYQFRHPSEEPVKGKLTDMSVQLLHKSADGKMVILAVRLLENHDAPNAVLATLFDHLPRTAGQTEQVADMVNTGGLLPADRGYWTYMGSLTTPPCTEGVRWFVFEQPVSLSRTQLRIFSSIFGVNSRPLQDAHGRTISANE